MIFVYKIVFVFHLKKHYAVKILVDTDLFRLLDCLTPHRFLMVGCQNGVRIICGDIKRWE